jgi:hypothetical protein
MLPETLTFKILFVPFAIISSENVAVMVPNLSKYVDLIVQDINFNVIPVAPVQAAPVLEQEPKQIVTDPIVERFVRRKVHVPYGKFIARRHGRPLVFHGPHTVERVYHVK